MTDETPYTDEELPVALAEMWNNGTTEDRRSISYIPVTLNAKQFDEFRSLLTRPWFVHYFENGFE